MYRRQPAAVPFVPSPMNLSRSILTLLFLGAITAASFFWDISQYMSPGKIEQLLQQSGALAPLTYIAVMGAAVVVSPLPSLPLDIAAGAYFGPVLGTVYSLLGGLLGAMTAFGIARLLGRPTVEKLLRGHVNFCRKCSDRLLTQVVFVSRLLPFVSFDLVSYGAGLTAMSPLRFGGATLLGMIPLTFIYNTAGSVLTVNTPASLFAGFFVTVFFFALPRWVEKKNILGLADRFIHHVNDKED